MPKITKSFTLTPSAVEQLVGISELAGMDQSAVVEGAIQAVWGIFASGGFRATPSVIEVLGLTGRAGGGFYLGGERKEAYEEA